LQGAQGIGKMEKKVKKYEEVTKSGIKENNRKHKNVKNKNSKKKIIKGKVKKKLVIRERMYKKKVNYKLHRSDDNIKMVLK
jgi:hypothetical protein